jgi:hypothetical protein
VARTLVAPLLDKRASIIEVKGTAESQWVNRIHHQLKGSVFAAGCSNWYINEFGRNAASWPGYASTYWKEALIPRWGVFDQSGGEKSWFLNALRRWFRTMSPMTYTFVAIALFSIALRRSGRLYDRLLRVLHLGVAQFVRQRRLGDLEIS